MLWGGHFVEAAAGTVYFAGDSGYGPHFAEIRRRLGAPDIALLPIGAYEPRWFMGVQHMNPADAVQAHFDLDPALSVAMHFGTFQLTDEAIDAPLRELDAAKRERGIPEHAFRALGFGETVRWRRP
jgi:L-ascorbate metabolism protein UlaG (beta-lactamase superfamily)